MIKPVLSIIITSFNTSDITINCLKSIFSDKGLQFDFSKIDNSAKTPAEIIIIDNASSDDSVLKINKLFHLLKFKNYKLIINSSNVGFSKANNQGLKIAKSNYVLFLNSDTIILHSAISQSLIWLSSHPESYGCTGQLLNPDGTIQASGGYFPNLPNIFTWSFGLDDLPLVNKIIKPLHPHTPDFYTHDSFFLSDHRQDWITGAFMLLRKNVLDQVGGFDSDYFMYGEELEMFYRIHLAFPSLQLWYLIGPQITHLGGASSKTKHIIYTREYLGVLSFIKKHRPSYEYQIASILININQFLRNTIYQLFKHHA